MSTVRRAARFQTIADLLNELGGIAPERVRLNPVPGRATEKHLIALNERKNGLYELVDGTLVEKAMGHTESSLGYDLIKLLGIYLDQNDLGYLTGEAGGTRLMPGLVRIPDVSFISWDRLPDRLFQRKPISPLVPDLAVEILSESNTRAEMNRKLREYFLAGVRLVWMVDPSSRTVEVFTRPDQSAVVTEEQTLDGGDVLPGLALPLRKLFARVPPAPAKKRRGRAPKKKRRKK